MRVYHLGVDMLRVQLLLNGATLDDQHIAWESDIDHQFGDVAPTNFNTISSLRGGGTLNGTLKVSPPLPHCNLVILCGTPVPNVRRV